MIAYYYLFEQFDGAIFQLFELDNVIDIYCECGYHHSHRANTHSEGKSNMSKTVLYILTDAIETSAIAYWAQGSDVQRDEERLVTAFKVRDGGFEGEPEKEGEMLIDEAAILAARDKIVNGEIQIRADIAAQFVGKPDDWDYDVEGVDCLIQTAFFGDLIYG
jgi:hypothetical protein